MPLLIRCPKGHRLSVPSQRAGQIVKCPVCGTTTKVPDKEVVEAAKSAANRQAARGPQASGGPQGKPAVPPPVPGRRGNMPGIAGGRPHAPASDPTAEQPTRDSQSDPKPDRKTSGGKPLPTAPKAKRPPPLPSRSARDDELPAHDTPKRPGYEPKPAAPGPTKPGSDSDAAAGAASDDTDRASSVGTPPKQSAEAAHGPSKSADKDSGSAPEPSNLPSEKKGGPTKKPGGKVRPKEKPKTAVRPKKGKRSRWRGEPFADDGPIPSDRQESSEDTSGLPSENEDDRPKETPAPVAEGEGSRDVKTTPKEGEKVDKPRPDAGRDRKKKGRRKPVDLMADTAEIASPAESHAVIEKTGLDDDKPAGKQAAPATVTAEEDGTLAAAVVQTSSDAEESAALVSRPSRAGALEAAGTDASQPAPVGGPALPEPVDAPPIAEPALQAPPLLLPVGVTCPADKRRTVYQLAICMAAVAIVSIYPAVRAIIAHFTSENSPGIDVWAPLVVLLTVVQLAYVVYVVQLPDWSSTRVLMILTVVVAMIYATVLGLVVMAAEENALILSLGLMNEFPGKNGLQQIAFWCFLILLLMCSQGYFWARVTFRWRRDDHQAVLGRG